MLKNRATRLGFMLMLAIAAIIYMTHFGGKHRSEVPAERELSAGTERAQPKPLHVRSESFADNRSAVESKDAPSVEMTEVTTSETLTSVQLGRVVGRISITIPSLLPEGWSN